MGCWHPGALLTWLLTCRSCRGSPSASARVVPGSPWWIPDTWSQPRQARPARCLTPAKRGSRVESAESWSVRVTALPAVGRMGVRCGAGMAQLCHPLWDPAPPPVPSQLCLPHVPHSPSHATSPHYGLSNSCHLMEGRVATSQLMQASGPQLSVCLGATWMLCPARPVAVLLGAERGSRCLCCCLHCFLPCCPPATLSVLLRHSRKQ